MKAKDIQNWQDNIALDRFNIIQHLLNPDLDKAKRIALLKSTSEDNDISEKTLKHFFIMSIELLIKVD